MLGNRVFVAFALAMVGMFTLQNQLYLLLPEGGRGGPPAWDGAARSRLPRRNRRQPAPADAGSPGALRGAGRRAWWIGAGLVLMGLAPSGTTADGRRSAPARRPATRGSGDCPGDGRALLLYLGVMIAQPFVMELIPAFGRSEAHRHVLRAVLRGLRHRRGGGQHRRRLAWTPVNTHRHGCPGGVLPSDSPPRPASPGCSGRRLHADPDRSERVSDHAQHEIC